jgi:xanthine dehydrogenase accessory factor
LAEQQIGRLKAPAGLDIGAVAPEEIAASILAELVQVRRWAAENAAQSGTSPQAVQNKQESTVPVANTALDPVCGMMVETATARHRSLYDGRQFYFCCPACKRLFEQNPQEYLTKHER